MSTKRRTVEVLADWAALGGPVRMGHLHATPTRGKEVFAFEYDPAWLGRRPAHVLDPTLRHHHGPQYPPSERDNFGLFLDSAPDRWGRVLLQRREAQHARAAGRKERRLTELDYLLGVYDGHRMGGLRFRIGAGPFLDDDVDMASPPWTSLRALEHASLALERDGEGASAEHDKWLRMLIAPGRSLGGARPKASVLDADGALWIAKFPSVKDTHDVGAWEAIVSELARRAGLRTADALHRQFGSGHHTFLTRRFDRTASGARTHFVSAMTMLERSDGEEGASYLDIAEAIVRFGAHPARDLEELWSRIVFSMCISNVDDHLRNHGFLLEDKGWSLAPAYDVNPVPTGDGLTLNVSETDNAQDLALAREIAPQLRVGARAAEAIIERVVDAVRDWRTVAEAFGIPRDERERMATAFRIADPV